MHRSPGVAGSHRQRIGTLRDMAHFDPSDPRWVKDPLPLFDELREEAPVHESPDGYWVFSRHADCLSVNLRVRQGCDC